MNKVENANKMKRKKKKPSVLFDPKLVWLGIAPGLLIFIFFRVM